ncbi:hypothetical protein SAMN05421780_108181 [Flexibacter flexilis DSM 6793]|uniref:Uncharacterized protein n=1 Tax=Flexibacter flexilis DSM 6793 TaxID=927664 RepID=A0A1I1LNL2_9BACT|nr:hypothetical protein [Flexibacter flexilis]SFC71050.1 hypothetical protein SAMN05421780_108181 [Flexibacter flexilis DSM 6793]
MTYHIPIPRYLAHYLAQAFGQGPYSSQHFEPKLWNRIAQAFQQYPVRKIRSLADQHFLAITLSESLIKQRRFHVRPEREKQIARLFTNMMYEELYLFMDSQRPNRKIVEALTEWCAHYDISEDDLAQDTLKKRYYRHREAKKNLGL